MSDTYQVIYSPEALDDIRKIYSYIAFELQVPDTALNQVNRIRKEVRQQLYCLLLGRFQSLYCHHNPYCIRRTGY